MMDKYVCIVLIVLLSVGIFTGEIGLLDSKLDNGKGSVYYLNFKPEQDAAWQKLAKLYTEKTGIPVTVVTAASGQYMTTLTAELSKIDAPTLFQLQGPTALNGKKDFCLDLSETNIYKELIDKSYSLRYLDDGVFGIAYVIESYGLIVNKKLLKKAGFSIDSIGSFKELKRIAENITSRQKQLKFSAFCSSGMDSSSSWRFVTHLANMPIFHEYKNKNISFSDSLDGTYLNNYRAIWNLYINNSTCSPDEISAKTADDARNEFIAQKGVFYQNGSWEYSNLITSGAFKEDELVMLPIYIGVDSEHNYGLCTGTENFWCVNKKACASDIKATLDFIEWCVTSDEGTMALAKEMGFVIPFKKAVKSENCFVLQNQKYTELGKIPVSWAFTTIPSEEWKNSLSSKLVQYAANQSDENWKSVEDSFLNNWQKEHRLSNGL